MADIYIKPTNNKFKDLTGRRFERLQIIEYRGQNKRGQSLWLVRCDCGEPDKVVHGHVLLSGKAKSCGCLQRETATTHGLHKHPAYAIHSDMMHRCYNSRCVAYPNYGGRGIYVCHEWHDRASFVAWVKKCFPPNGLIPEELSIDRKDNDGPYSPENCRWATAKEQANNTRSNHLLAIDGTQQTLMQLSEKYKINYWTLSDRLKSGWPIEKALATPVRRKVARPQRH